MLQKVPNTLSLWYKLRKALGIELLINQSLDWYNAEMEDCATGYARLLWAFGRCKQTCSDPVVLIEKWTSPLGGSKASGTSDAILISDGTMRTWLTINTVLILVSWRPIHRWSVTPLALWNFRWYLLDIDTVSMTASTNWTMKCFYLWNQQGWPNLHQWADEKFWNLPPDLAFAGDGNFLCGKWCEML